MTYHLIRHHRRCRTQGCHTVFKLLPPSCFFLLETLDLQPKTDAHLPRRLERRFSCFHPCLCLFLHVELLLQLLPLRLGLFCHPTVHGVR